MSRHQDELQNLLSKNRGSCYIKDCENKPAWQPIILLFAQCASDCDFPHLGEPALMAPSWSYCEDHMKELKVDTLMNDNLFETIAASFTQAGKKVPVRDWCSFSFHKIPDNVVTLCPRLVKNPEPEPPAA